MTSLKEKKLITNLRLVSAFMQPVPEGHQKLHPLNLPGSV